MLRLLFALLLPVAGWSCTCVIGAPPCQAAWKASAIFAGRVADVRRETRDPDSRGIVQVNGFLGVHALFEVTEPLLGMEGFGKQVEIVTGMGGGDCGYHFEPGASYVVYAYKTAQGLLSASICSRTAPIEKAEPDLAYLRSLKHGLPTSYIFGAVNDVERRGAPAGIAGAIVFLTGSEIHRTFTTGQDGSFRFDSLPPGTYQVSVSNRGYSDRTEPPVEVHAGGCAYVPEYIAVDRRVTGRVRMPDGLPASGITVELVPAVPTEKLSLPFAVVQSKTNSDGLYELKNIPSGRYYLGVNIVHTPSSEMPFGRAMFPGVAEPAESAILTVANLPDTKTCDFMISARQTQRALEGFVYWPDGRPARNVSIFLEDIRFPWQTNSVAAETSENGHFKVNVFDATRYRIHAVSQAPFTNQATSAEPLAIVPGQVFERPFALILNRKGHSAAALSGKGLERWRAGLGL